MTPQDAEVIVVGAGPAGLAAAQELAARNVRRVLVLDRDDEAGGLPRFCHHFGFGWEYTHRLETGPGLVQRLSRKLENTSVGVMTRATALVVNPGPEVEIVSPQTGYVRARPRAVILATGIRERPRSARLIPGRRPEHGILTTGQLQQMVKRGVAVAGKHAVIVGTEHVAFSVLLTARHAGLKVVAMAGLEDRIMSYAGAGWLARALGAVIHLSSTIEDIRGSERVESVTLRGPSGSMSLFCDTVIFTGDFVPESALLRAGDIAIDSLTGGPIVDQFGRTSAVGVFAAGNLLRAVESSGMAAIEGARAGASTAAYLEGSLGWSDGAARISLGDGIAYIMPQLWAPMSDNATHLQPLPISLRTVADTRGRLRLSQGGRELWASERRRFMRQRRIKLPAEILNRLAADHGALLDLA